MSNTRILVVEDESIVAKDIQNTLVKLGYEVPATASSAASAYEKLEMIKPDLVFLDIKLKGEEDGIHIAEHIKEKYNIPVIFLTSYVDQTTLDRAKVTEPYGYIVKPFNESDLKTTVEMALFKFGRDREVRDREQRLVNALAKVDESIIIIDVDGRISYLNEKAENETNEDPNNMLPKTSYNPSYTPTPSDLSRQVPQTAWLRFASRCWHKPIHRPRESDNLFPEA
jgi:CheY-like chemotaxis protein